MIENEKYKKVRNTLDAMKFLGTLHPDSVGLVDNILREMMRFQTRCQDA